MAMVATSTAARSACKSGDPVRWGMLPPSTRWISNEKEKRVFSGWLGQGDAQVSEDSPEYVQFPGPDDPEP